MVGFAIAYRPPNNFISPGTLKVCEIIYMKSYKWNNRIGQKLKKLYTATVLFLSQLF